MKCTHCKQEEHEDDNPVMEEQLMNLLVLRTSNKHKNLPQKQMWSAPSESAEEKILALKAELKALKKSTKQWWTKPDKTT